jgi:hypothetical protein
MVDEVVSFCIVKNKEVAPFPHSGLSLHLVHKTSRVLLHFAQVFLVGPSADIAQSPFGTFLLPAVKLSHDVPFIEYGEAQVLEELTRMQPCRYRLPDACVGARIRAKDQRVLFRQRGRALLDMSLLTVVGELIIEKLIHRPRRAPLIGWETDAYQVVRIEIDISGILYSLEQDVCPGFLQAFLDGQCHLFGVAGL